MVLQVADGLKSSAQGLRSGDISIMDYLDKLEAHFDRIEGSISAFMPERGRFERLRREAEILLDRYPDPESRPPLFGVPVGVKDIFHVDGFETQAGSRLPPSELKGEEAECVTVLKRSGVLILGKTMTTEFAYFEPGPTRNPRNLDHTPGGSSSGSAAAVAAGLCPLATGSQTIGSIIRPASFCGVVGFKPSYDRISRAGVIPLAPSIDHIGFLISDMSGAELVASLLCQNWTAGKGRRKPVLGVPEGVYLKRASMEALTYFSIVRRRLEKAGFEIKSIEAMPDFEEIYNRHNLVLAAEAAKVHAGWITRFEELYRPKTVELIKRGQQISEESLTDALSGLERLRSDLTGLMKENDIDLWITPSTKGPAPKGLESTGDPVMNLPWTHSGLPTLNLPAGQDRNGLPMGLQLSAHWYADEDLLSWATDIEATLKIPDQ